MDLEGYNTPLLVSSASKDAQDSSSGIPHLTISQTALAMGQSSDSSTLSRDHTSKRPRLDANLHSRERRNSLLKLTEDDSETSLNVQSENMESESVGLALQDILDTCTRSIADDLEFPIEGHLSNVLPPSHSVDELGGSIPEKKENKLDETDGAESHHVHNTHSLPKSLPSAASFAYKSKASSARRDGRPIRLNSRMVVARAEGGAPLFLYKHQVGGHMPFLITNKGEVCKPAIPLEVRFYEEMDRSFPSLKPFTPEALGVIKVELSEETLHPLPSTAQILQNGGGAGRASKSKRSPLPSPSQRMTTNPDTFTASSEAAESHKTLRNYLPSPLFTTEQYEPIAGKRTSGGHSRGGSRDECLLSSSGGDDPGKFGTEDLDATSIHSFNSTSMQSVLSTPTASDDEGSRPQTPQAAEFSRNLWEHFGQRQLKRANSGLSASSQSRRLLHSYFIMKDLTGGYKRPCILDVKMGTRQHGEDTAPEKALRHIARCNSTTSASMGMRLCGMQVYLQSEQRYRLRDKMWGRALTKDNVEQALALYFHNGIRLRRDVISGMIKKLQQLASVITQVDHVRFYSSSLLLLYEGDALGCGNNDALDQLQISDSCNIDLRMIDFAHSHIDSSLEGPDEGYLLGVNNIIELCENILAQE